MPKKELTKEEQDRAAGDAQAKKDQPAWTRSKRHAEAKPYYPGIPDEISPEEANWQRDNNPNYAQYRDVIKERVAAYNEKHAPKEAANTTSAAAEESASPAPAASKARSKE